MIRGLFFVEFLHLLNLEITEWSFNLFANLKQDSLCHCNLIYVEPLEQLFNKKIGWLMVNVCTKNYFIWMIKFKKNYTEFFTVVEILNSV